jgi:hypothetical protein
MTDNTKSLFIILIYKLHYIILWLVLSSMQSKPIATKVGSSNSAHGEVYSIQHYVIQFVRKITPFCREKGLNISKCSQKTYIKKWQTIQRQNDKQRSTKHYRDRKLKTERCTRYNIMWYSLSVTCDRSANFLRVLRFPPSIKSIPTI